MTSRRLTLGLCSFATLSACVLFNAFYLQGARTHPARTERLPPSAPPTSEVAQLPLPVVAPGTAPDTIAAIQRELDLRGYHGGPSDGVASPATRAAIFAFEYDQGLPLTATPSEALLATIILGAGDAVPAALSQTQILGPQAVQLVKSVQQQLEALGYGPLDGTGRFDEPTARAITRFEHDQKLTQTGKISANIVARLARLAPQGP